MENCTRNFESNKEYRNVKETVYFYYTGFFSTNSFSFWSYSPEHGGHFTKLFH